MFHHVLFNVPLLFFIILYFTAKLPYGELVTWQKCLWKNCCSKGVYGKDAYGQST